MSTVDRFHEIPLGAGDGQPVTLPVTVAQYAELVRHGHFDDQSGQVELVNGRVIQMNPQGPEHASPIDILGEWSVEQSKRQFWIRIEKPIELLASSSAPEPDVAWVKRQSYARRHPRPEEIALVIEASVHSVAFDRGEKCDIYALAGIPEYWQIDVPRRKFRVHRDPRAGVFSTITTHGVGESISPLCLPSALLEIASLFELRDR